MIKYLLLSDVLADYGCSVENILKVVPYLSTADIDRYTYRNKKMKSIHKPPVNESFLRIYVSVHGFQKTIVDMGKLYDINSVVETSQELGVIPFIDVHKLRDDIIELYSIYNLTLRQIAGLLSTYTGSTPDHSNIRRALKRFGIDIKSSYIKTPRIITEKEVMLCIKYVHFFKIAATPDNFKLLCGKFANIQHKGLIADILLYPENYTIRQCGFCKTHFVGIEYYCKRCQKKINQSAV